MSDGPTITIERAGELLHCSRARVFELIAAGVVDRGPRYGRRSTVITETVLRAAVAPASSGEALKHPRRARRRRQLAERLAAVPVKATGS
jgi:hypothetical protein